MTESGSGFSIPRVARGFVGTEVLIWMVGKLTEGIAKDIGRGVSKDKIMARLVRDGVPAEASIRLVEDAEESIVAYKSSPEARKAMARAYARHMVYGILWAVGGAVVTAVTYTNAATGHGGGRYVIAWGAIAFGLFDFLRGLFGWLKYSASSS